MTPVTPRALSLAADLVRAWEGCRTVAYPDSNGIPTIGFGHCNGVQLGQTCAKTQADAWLIDDLAEAAKAITQYVKVPLSDHKAAALLSFVFNVGAGNFETSTLLLRLNQGDYVGASKQFGRWVHDTNGQMLNGLVKRRAAETTLFNSPDSPLAKGPVA